MCYERTVGVKPMQNVFVLAASHCFIFGGKLFSNGASLQLIYFDAQACHLWESNPLLVNVVMLSSM